MEKKTKSLTIRLSQTNFDKLKTVSNVHGIPMTQIIEQTIKKIKS
jgi:predicted DNA binding CopG/RHH family protein